MLKVNHERRWQYDCTVWPWPPPTVLRWCVRLQASPPVQPIEAEAAYLRYVSVKGLSCLSYFVREAEFEKMPSLQDTTYTACLINIFISQQFSMPKSTTLIGLMFNLCLTSIPHRSVKAYELVRDSHAKKKQEYFSRKPLLLQNQQKLGKLSFLTRQGKNFFQFWNILNKKMVERILRKSEFLPGKT